MFERADFEMLLMDASTAATIQGIVEDAFCGINARGWDSINTTPDPALTVLVFTHDEFSAFLRANDVVRKAIAEMAKAFYETDFKA